MPLETRRLFVAIQEAIKTDPIFRVDLARSLAELVATTLPVEPLYDMRIAAFLIPMSYSGLKGFLQRHKEEFPARYRLAGRGHRRVRMLYAREIRNIRARVIRGHFDPLSCLTYK
jgi:hypothetical protein